MMEAGVVLDLMGEPLFWHTPRDRSVGALPDSVDLWSIFWENRENISGFAHSHPGYGMTGPSMTDLTTFAAVEAGLGKRLDWWITSGDSMVLVRWHPGQHAQEYITVAVRVQPQWVLDLREISTYKRG